ncbi:Hypothetical predicted protein, partial [Olea europaea subsp. europaea]
MTRLEEEALANSVPTTEVRLWGTTMASYSPHPPICLKQLSNIPDPSRTLALYSNLHKFCLVGVSGTQLTSQTLFPNAKIGIRVLRNRSGILYKAKV